MTQYDMSTIEFNIILSRDHILISSDGDILLVDTGSPMSFHENGSIRLGDEEFPVATSLMGVDSVYVADKVGGSPSPGCWVWTSSAGWV